MAAASSSIVNITCNFEFKFYPQAILHTDLLLGSEVDI